MAIGDKIKELRTKHGLSQVELARVTGVSDKAVSTWEQNKVIPRMGAIQKIADFFGGQKSETKLITDYRNLNGNNRQEINMMIALFLSQQCGDNFSSNAAAV